MFFIKKTEHVFFQENTTHDSNILSCYYTHYARGCPTLTTLLYSYIPSLLPFFTSARPLQFDYFKTLSSLYNCNNTCLIKIVKTAALSPIHSKESKLLFYGPSTVLNYCNLQVLFFSYSEEVWRLVVTIKNHKKSGRWRH